MNLYLNTISTGAEAVKLVSLALLDTDGVAFYAELSDHPLCSSSEEIHNYHIRQIKAGLGYPTTINIQLRNVGLLTHLEYVLGDEDFVRENLRGFLSRYAEVKLHCSWDAYDWVLFSVLFGGALRVPPNVVPVPFNLARSCFGGEVERRFFDTVASATTVYNSLLNAALLKEYHRGFE